MYGGSPTTRSIQIIVGVVLGFLTALCLFVGLLGIYAIIFQHDNTNITFIISLIFTPIGIIGLIISKRLITARGTSKGAGLLSPNEYRFVGYFFIAISIFMVIYGISHSTMKHILLFTGAFNINLFLFYSSYTIFARGNEKYP